MSILLANKSYSVSPLSLIHDFFLRAFALCFFFVLAAAAFSLTGRRRNRFLPSLAATTPLLLPPPFSPSPAAESYCRNMLLESRNVLSPTMTNNRDGY
jgi:hypothetical protein